jgi:L-Ala-D/L-Glu epimerase / N-acetyl-D-glutamate racemase
MRIVDVTVHRIAIPFRQPFGHALHWREKADAVILCIASDGRARGWGEILPRRYLGGGTVEAVLSRELPDLVQSWRGRSFESAEQVMEALRDERPLGPRSLATYAGWEIAMLDLAGKVFGFAAGDVLGRIIGPELEPGVVIGFDVTTEFLERHCLLLRLAGRRHIKVKVGRPDDLRRLEIVNAVFGPAVPIRVDANASWSEEEAVTQVRRMHRWNVCSVEQPVTAHDLHAMRHVREKTGMPVVADESLCTMQDALSIIQAGAADVFNIRIAKCGGFLASHALVKLARDWGIICQLGTLVGETGILSRASEVFGERVEGFQFLEGKLQNRQLLVQDILQESAIRGKHGLGITVAEERIARWATPAAPTMFAEIEGVPT